MTQATATAPQTSKAQTPSAAPTAPKVRKGGKYFVLEGEASDFRERVKKETGVVSTSGSVIYWGGSDYCRLRFAEQQHLFKDGDWLRLEGDVKEFDGNTYAGSWKVTHVNDMPV